MRLLSLVLLFILHFNYKATANDSLAIKYLINKIRNQQVQDDPYFPKGIFPSYRAHYFNQETLKKDDNSFFTGLIVLTLRQLYPILDTSSKLICDSIIEEAKPVFHRFQNRKGKNVYSFWQTNPVKYFPNSTILSLFKSNALPDDADCSVITLMALNASSVTATEVHKYLQEFTSNKRHRVQSTYAYFKKLPAYSTWLGHKVPVDFDICVLSNILYFVHKYALDYTAADSASLQIISQSVEKRLYINDAEYLSPYYIKTPVILYHLARLMSSGKIPELERYRKQLITDAKECFVKTNCNMEKVLLSTALLRWNELPPDMDSDLQYVHTLSSRDFVFFVANMASMLPNPFNRFITQSNIVRFDYYCPAYNNVLLLEYFVLKRIHNMTSTF